jgi:hypothetical protein
VLSHYLLIMKRSSAPSLICRHPYISLGPIKKKLAPLFPFSPTTTELSLPHQTLLPPKQIRLPPPSLGAGKMERGRYLNLVRILHCPQDVIEATVPREAWMGVARKWVRGAVRIPACVRSSKDEPNFRGDKVLSSFYHLATLC